MTNCYHQTDQKIVYKGKKYPIDFLYDYNEIHKIEIFNNVIKMI